jgi:hypothetical protein
MAMYRPPPISRARNGIKIENISKAPKNATAPTAAATAKKITEISDFGNPKNN